jgi:hypothetical protein
MGEVDRRPQSRSRNHPKRRISVRLRADGLLRRPVRKGRPAARDEFTEGGFGYQKQVSGLPQSESGLRTARATPSEIEG